MTEQVSNLSWSDRFNCAVGLFDTVYKIGRKCVTERVQALCFNSCGFQYSVISFSEIYRSCIITVLVGHKGCIFAKVSFLESLNQLRNKLIADGKYTDAVDEVLLKIIGAKRKKFKVIFKEA